jgi:hypothetical protein
VQVDLDLLIFEERNMFPKEVLMEVTAVEVDTL